MLTAANVIAWRQGQAAPSPRLPSAAIVTHQGYLFLRRGPWERRSGDRRFSFDRRSLAKGAVTLAGVRGVGAPATAIAIEELAVAGVRRLVAVDIAGSLVAGVRSGGIVLIESAIACDGTSPHYSRDRLVRGDEGLIHRLRQRLTAEGIAFSSGTVWSTDAVYRETPSKLDEAREQGAILADMETACVFAVAGALGIEAAALLVAADELHGGWRPPAEMRGVRANVHRALGAATACLQP